jgi:hypothetical protein
MKATRVSCSPWLKWCKRLWAKPEVVAIAASLGIRPREAAACCMCVWEWVDDNFAVRNVPANEDAIMRVNASAAANIGFVDSIAGFKGFANAMIREGWLRVGDGFIAVPKFGKHNLETAKARAENLDRQNRYRAKVRADEAGVDRQLVTEVSHELRDNGVTYRDRDKEEENQAGPPFSADVDQVRQDWNGAVAGEMKPVEAMSARIAETVVERLADPVWRDSYRNALSRLKALPFLQFGSDKGGRGKGPLRFTEFLEGDGAGRDGSPRVNLVARILNGDFDEHGKRHAGGDRRDDGAAARAKPGKVFDGETDYSGLRVLSNEVEPEPAAAGAAG